MKEMPILIKPVSESLSQKVQNSKNTDRSGALAILANSFKVLVHKLGDNLDASMGFTARRDGLNTLTETSSSSNYYDDPPNMPHDGRGQQEISDNRNDNFSHRGSEPSRNEYEETSRHDPASKNYEEHSSGKRDSQNNKQEEQFGQKDSHGNSSSDDTGASNLVDNPKGSAENQGAVKSSEQGPSTINKTIMPDSGPSALHLLSQGNLSNLGTETTKADEANLRSTLGAKSNATSPSLNRGVHAAETGQQSASGSSQNIQRVAGGEGQVKTDTTANTQDTIRQQSNQIARGLADNARVQINVNVSDEAGSLTSRPTASLAAGTALNAENKGQSQSGSQQNNHISTPGPNAAAISHQSQNNQGHGQNTQTNANKGQAQIISQFGPKGMGSAASSGGIHSGISTNSFEGSSGSSNIASTGQTQNLQQSPQTQQIQQTARPQQPLQSSVAEQVSVKISKALQAGQDRITIRLNPAELGRVEVKMELTYDGRTTAVVTADNRDTLEMLRRDSSDLQKALQEGGLQLSDSDLTFNLRGEQSQTAEGDDGEQTSDGIDEEELTEDMNDQEPEIIIAHEGGLLINGRLDVRA